MKKTPPFFLFAFVLTLLLAYWLRVHDLNGLGLHFDESRNFVRAWRLAEGYGSSWLFDDIPEPSDGIGRGIFFFFVGSTIFTGRLLTVFLNLVAVAGTIGAARALFWGHKQRDIIALSSGITLAIIPSSIIFSRTLLRTNWIPPISMIALMLIVWAWQTKKTVYYILAGVFTALSAMFYPSGLMFPPSIVLLMGFTFLTNRRQWPGFRKIGIMTIAAAITFSPWIYLYLRIDGWLDNRANATDYQQILNDSDLLWHNFKVTIETLYTPFPRYPKVGYHFAARYNAFKTAFLNPALMILLICGIVFGLWNWRRRGALAPVVIGFMMLIPTIVTSDPRITSRFVPIFPELALLVGMGVGLIFGLIPKKSLAWGGLVGILGYSAIFSYQSIDYHFHEEPTLFDHPTEEFGIDWNYRIRLRDLMAYIADSDTPVYFPMNLLDYPTTVAYSRAQDFPKMRGYEGESLPTGHIIVPEDITYGTYDVNRRSNYAVMLPDLGEIVILPPVSDWDSLSRFEAQVLSKGKPFYNREGWLLGHQLPILQENNPFNNVEVRSFESVEPIAVFEDNLELLGLVAPTHLTPDTWIPITLYWRLREHTGTDYFVFLQLRENEVNRRGGQDDMFSGIYRWVFPTVMWEPDNIVPEVRWVYVFPDIPQGGYRFAINVHKHPNTSTVEFTNRYGAKEQDGWLIVGQTWVQTTPFPDPPVNALEINAILSDSVQGEIIRLTHAQVEPSLVRLLPGQTVKVTLYWETLHPPAFDYTMFIHLLDHTGNLVTQIDTPLYEEHFPTSTWYTGSRVVTSHTLTVPATAERSFRLNIGMYLWPSLQHLAVGNTNVITLQPQIFGG